MPMPNPKRILITRPDLSTRWGVSIDTLRRREKTGELTAIKIGANTVRYDLTEVERYEQEATA